MAIPLFRLLLEPFLVLQIQLNQVCVYTNLLLLQILAAAVGADVVGVAVMTILSSWFRQMMFGGNLCFL